MFMRIVINTAYGVGDKELELRLVLRQEEWYNLSSGINLS